MDISAILAQSLSAPSGDNCQPWRFSISENNTVELYNEPSADQSLYNFGQSASYIAEGALLENISIVAGSFGAEAVIKTFPDSANINHVATITFRDSMRGPDPFYPYVAKRATNRKPYDKKLLTDLELQELQNAVEHNSHVMLANGAEEIKKLSWAASRNEQLVLSNYGLHKFLFDHVRWTDKEANETRNGFPIKTLELVGPQGLVFRLVKRWQVMKFFSIFGLPSLVAADNRKIYETSGGFGIVTQVDDSPDSFLATGRLIQRLWLKATELGLSLHPLTGVVLLRNRLQAGERSQFTEQQKALIGQAHKSIREVFDLSDDTIISFMWRMGHATMPPTAIAPRMSLDRVIVGSERSVSEDTRERRIDLIIKDLESLQGSEKYDSYAISENIVFFRAARSVLSFLKWALFRAPRIDGQRIVELTDLPFRRWDREMHERLIATQKKDFPGLIKPLVQAIVDYVKAERRPLILANLGSGGMEVERQVIKLLQQDDWAIPVVFCGIDKSPITHDMAKQNLRELAGVSFHEIDELTPAGLDQIRGNKAVYRVVLARNDIFELDETLPNQYLDLVYHSLFRHHLTEKQSQGLDLILKKVSKRIFEYDGVRSWLFFIPQTLEAWQYPAFLNGSLFSNLRYKTKRELRRGLGEWSIAFSRIGTYLKQYPK
jgi:hypothetical protein